MKKKINKNKWLEKAKKRNQKYIGNGDAIDFREVVYRDTREITDKGGPC